MINYIIQSKLVYLAVSLTFYCACWAWDLPWQFVLGSMAFSYYEFLRGWDQGETTLACALREQAKQAALTFDKIRRRP